jgi:competence protein ComEC
VVLLVQVAGLRLLLTGDVEPEGQAVLARMLPGLRVDVLKVPHHGSRFQDLDFLTSLGAGLALVSVGADNDYGHPAAETLEPLAATGADVLRTDLDGDVAAARRGDSVVAVTSGGLPRRGEVAATSARCDRLVPPWRTSRHPVPPTSSAGSRW